MKNFYILVDCNKKGIDECELWRMFDKEKALEKAKNEIDYLKYQQENGNDKDSYLLLYEYEDVDDLLNENNLKDFDNYFSDNYIKDYGEKVFTNFNILLDSRKTL